MTTTSLRRRLARPLLGAAGALCALAVGAPAAQADDLPIGCTFTAFANLRVSADTLPKGADQYTETLKGILAFPASVTAPVSEIGAMPASRRERRAWREMQATEAAKFERKGNRVARDLERAYERAIEDAEANQTSRNDIIDRNYAAAQRRLDANNECAQDLFQIKAATAMREFDTALQGELQAADVNYQGTLKSITVAYQGTAQPGDTQGVLERASAALAAADQQCRAKKGKNAENVNYATPDGELPQIVARKKKNDSKKNGSKKGDSKKTAKKADSDGNNINDKYEDDYRACQERARAAYAAYVEAAQAEQQAQIDAAEAQMSAATSAAQSKYDHEVNMWQLTNRLYSFHYDDASAQLDGAYRDAMRRSDRRALEEIRLINDAQRQAARLIEDFYGIEVGD